MRRLSWLGAALLVPALAWAGPPDGALRRLFEGGSQSGDRLEAFRAEAPAAQEGKPVVPPDLAAARERWGNQAQLSKLQAVRPGPQERFSFAVLGDVETGRYPWSRLMAPKGAFRELMRQAHAENPDLVVQLGDFVSHGDAKNYRKYLQVLERLIRLPYFSVIGNHDRPQPNQDDGDKSLYRAVFGETDFFFDHGGWRFIALDSSDRKVTPAQLDWLESALAGAPRSMIFTHVPPRYLKGKLKSPPRKGVQAEGINFSAYFSEGSSGFEALVTRYRPARVYMGHIHALATADHAGVRHVLTGGGGSPLYPLPPSYPKRRIAHFILSTAGPDGVRDSVREIDGARLEL